MKRKVIKNLSLFITIWVALCFLMSVYSFISKPVLSYGNTDADGYGNYDVRHGKNEINMTIDEFKDGNFYGTGELIIRSKEGKKAYAKGERFIIDFSGINNIRPIFNWIDVAPQKTTNYANVLISEKERIHTIGNDFFFPFDTYKIYINLSFQVFYGIEKENFTKEADIGSVSYKLPGTFSLSRIEKIPVEECDFDDCKVVRNINVGERDIYHQIKRENWFVWFSLGLAGIVFAPIMILLITTTKSMNVDIIASLFSIYTIRSILVGVSSKIYFIDFIFAFVITAIVVISMLKVAYASKTP